MRNVILLIIFSIFFLNLVQPVFAHCPLCTAATGAAVAVTRWYGIDDTVVGLFIGGMIVSTSIWFNNILKRRNKGKEHIPFQSFAILLLSFILTVITFSFADLIGPNNLFKIFGFDRILFGALIGIAVSFVSFRFHDFIRIHNRNKNYFPYQSILIFILFLLASSSILYLVI